MRLYEILKEDDQQVNQIVNDLTTTLLYFAKATKSNKIKTNDVVKVLSSKGHDGIDPESILSIATQSPVVQTATSEYIEIKDTNPVSSAGGEEQNDADLNKEKVGDMAMNAANQEINNELPQ